VILTATAKSTGPSASPMRRVSMRMISCSRAKSTN
jgi:hypothetical protein